MKKLIVAILAIVFGSLLFAQDSDEALAKKCFNVYASDMPKGTVTSTKIMLKVGKIYEGVAEINDTFTPPPADIEKGFSLFSDNYNDDVYPNSVPRKGSLNSAAAGFAAPGEREPLVIGVYPLKNLKDITVSVSPLEGKNGAKIPAGNILINYVKYDYEPQGVSWYCKGKYLIEENKIHGLKETPRMFWLLVSVPENAAAGEYIGEATVTAGGETASIGLSVTVQPFSFEPFTDEYYFGAFTYLPFDLPEEAIEKYLIEMKKMRMNCMHGKLVGALKITPAGAVIDFSKVDKNMKLMTRYGIKIVMLEMTGLPNEFVDNMKCGYYDETFNKAYLAMLAQLKEKQEKGGWPTIQIMYDEPREVDTDNPRPHARTYWDIENLLKLHEKAGVAALPTYMSDDGGPRAEDHTKRATYWDLGGKSPCSMTHGWAPSAKLMKEVVKQGKTLYIYNNGYGRFQFGLLTFQLEAKGNVQFWYKSEDKLNTQAEFPTSYAVAGQKDRDIPTLRWIRTEKGVDDFRYIYTLQKAIEKAKDKEAPAVKAAQDYLKGLKSITFDKPSVDGRQADTVGADTLKKFGGGKLDLMKMTLAKHINAVKGAAQ